MTTEPTAADKAAAKQIIYCGVTVGSTTSSEWVQRELQRVENEREYAALVIAQHMAPERQAAAELYYACELTVSAVTGLSRERPSNPVHAIIWDQLKDAMDHARAAIARAKENDRLKAELSKARQERLKR